MRPASGRPLVLAARSAARAFAARQARVQPGEGAGAWNPFYLRWALAKARRVSRRGAPRQPGVFALALLHFHLHCGGARREGGVPGHVASEARDAPRRSRVPRRDRPLRFAPTARVSRALPREAQRRCQPMAASFDSPSIRIHRETRIESRTARDLMDRGRALIAAPGSLQPVAPGLASRRFLRRTPSGQPWAPAGSPRISFPLELIRRRQRVGPSATTRARDEARSSNGATVRSPGLVWRTHAAHENSVANRRPGGQPTFGSVASPTQPASARVAPAQLAQTPAAKLAVRLASLDPALVDRLADDVIRRVERRVRIERERRGI